MPGRKIAEGGFSPSVGGGHRFHPGRHNRDGVIKIVGVLNFRLLSRSL